MPARAYKPLSAAQRATDGDGRNPTNWTGARPPLSLLSLERTGSDHGTNSIYALD